MEHPGFYISENLPDDPEAAGFYLFWTPCSWVIIVLIIHILIISRESDFTFLIEERINFVAFCFVFLATVVFWHLKKKNCMLGAGSSIAMCFGCAEKDGASGPLGVFKGPFIP